MKGLLVDFGGVLTTNVFDSFRDFCLAEGLEPEAIKRLFREDPRALELVRGLETGALGEDEFGERFGELLEIGGRIGLVDRMFGGLLPDEEMLHKPQPEIFRLGAERAGVEPEDCVFVDDLRENCEGAAAVGMTAALHRGSDTTVPELERLLGVELR